MAKFVYKMQNILNIKMRLETQAKTEFSQASARLDEEEDKLRSLILRRRIACGNRTAIVEHEATTSKISDEQLFYCNQRGLSTEDAVGLIVGGFAKEVMAK